MVLKKLLDASSKSEPNQVVRVLDLDEEEKPTPTSESVNADDTLPTQIPQRYAFDGRFDLKKLDGFRDIRKQLKLNKLEDEFVSETIKILSLYDPSDKQYSHKIVQNACYWAEFIFTIQPKLGDVKNRAVVKACKPFFNGDEDLIKSAIEFVLPNIPKNSFLRRSYVYVSRLFFLIMSRYVNQS